MDFTRQETILPALIMEPETLVPAILNTGILMATILLMQKTGWSMGNNFPRYDYSLNIQADYKGFDFNIYLFGVGKRDNYISGVAVQPFNAGNWIASGLVSQETCWTAGKTNAAYPRLYNGGNGNYAGSDFWLRNGAFMRVKHITLGYSLPAGFLKRLHLSQLSSFM